MKFISNAFSINMVESPKVGGYFSVNFHRISTAEVDALLREDYFKSVIGHADMAEIVGKMVNHVIPFNRESVKLRSGDELIVCQYSGPRLPNGCVELPAGAQIDFFWLEIN